MAQCGEADAMAISFFRVHTRYGYHQSGVLSRLMFGAQNEPQHLSGLVRRILYQFIGPN